MLNESYALREAMQNHDIHPPHAWHDQMKAPPNHDVVIEIRFKDNGDIGRVLFLQSDQRWKNQALFRAYEFKVSGPNAGVRFPVICPNYQKVANMVTPKEERIDRFKEIFLLKHQTLIEKLVPALRRLIPIDEPLPVLGTMLGALESEGSNLSLDDICSHLEDKKARDLEKLIQANKRILICYELDDWRQYGSYPINSTEVLKSIDVLLKRYAEENKSSDSTAGKDAFGLSANGSDGKYPTVKIKGLSDIITLALNTKDAPNLSRWGMKSASQAFQVGEDSRKRVVEALEWVTQPDLEGKTWRNLSSLTGNKEILIINAGASQEDIWMDSFMPPVSDGSDEADYVASAKCFIRVIDGMTLEQLPENISIFGLRNTTNKMAGVHTYGNYTPEVLVKSAEEWGNAAANIPELILYRSSQETRHVRAIYPAQTVWVVNHSNKVEKAKKAPRLMDICEVFELFSGSSYQQQAVAKRILSTLAGRPIRSLLQYAALFRNVPAGLKPKVKKDVQSLLLKLPCLLGIVLYKINCSKEEYMSSAPYLIGQYLALLDEAHLLHYQVNNGGKPPKSLVGRSRYRGENPRLH